LRKALFVAALIAGSIVPAAATAAEPLGRLFFTPKQRNDLDAGKYAGALAPVVPIPRTVHLDGVVTRSDADRTVWINGKVYHNGSPDGVQVNTNPGSPAATSIRVPGKAATTRVKVGQQLDLNSGKVREDFSRQAGTAGGGATAGNPAAQPIAEKKSEAAQSATPVPESKDANPPTVAR
jgi:hypothetical protein